MSKPSDQIVKGLYRPLAVMFVFTLVINALMLIQPIYMLQIYDRVMASGSLDTLMYISILAALALLLLGALDICRSFLAGRMGAQFEVLVAADAFQAALSGPRAAAGDVQALRDVQAIRNFLGGRALFAFLDLPFAPLFILLLYFVHPNLFWLTVIGAAVLTGIAFLNRSISEKSAKEASAASLRSNAVAQTFARSSESISAMGMLGNVTRVWGQEEAAALANADRLNFINSVFAGISRALRMGLQVSIYGYGGYLVLEGEMTAGMIFAASLIAGRALQPIDQVIAGWKGLTETRKAWTRVREAYDGLARRPETTDLPEPAGRVDIEQVVVFPPRAQPGTEAILKRVSATIAKGSCVAVIGPSGAGKSTLIRTMIGSLEPRSGAVRIDGSDIRHWDREKLGRYFGYLAQDAELLPGTVAQNISRFEEDADGEGVVAAAQKAHVHHLIQKLPNGYDTVVGVGGHQLSGGQRQRLGLARAFYGTPRVLVLDEPNANLDGEGDLALDRALLKAREEGVTVLIVTQRRQIAERADSVMILKDGALEDFGPRNDVFARQAERVRLAQAAQKAGKPFQAPQKVVAGRFPAVVDGGAGTPGAASGPAAGAASAGDAAAESGTTGSAAAPGTDVAVRSAATGN